MCTAWCRSRQPSFYYYYTIHGRHIRHLFTGYERGSKMRFYSLNIKITYPCSRTMCVCVCARLFQHKCKELALRLMKQKLILFLFFFLLHNDIFNVCRFFLYVSQKLVCAYGWAWMSEHFFLENWRSLSIRLEMSRGEL